MTGTVLNAGYLIVRSTFYPGVSGQTETDNKWLKAVTESHQVMRTYEREGCISTLEGRQSHGRVGIDA